MNVFIQTGKPKTVKKSRHFFLIIYYADQIIIERYR